MAFRANYNRDRAERDRTARARTAEKLRKKEEKAAQRKALRSGDESQPGESAAEVPENPKSEES
jgi:hypothetical protein